MKYKRSEPLTNRAMIIKKFQNALASDDKKTMEDILTELDKAYYSLSHSSLVEDNVYEQLLQSYKERHGEWKQEVIGGDCSRSGESILPRSKLPYTMGSMSKFRNMPAEVKGAKRWAKNYTGEVVVEGKADGISILISNQGGDIRAWSRGDGKSGEDLTRFVSSFNIPEGWVIRGELVMPNSIYTSKYASEFTRPLGAVCGIASRKTGWEDAQSELKIIGFEILEPRTFTANDQLIEMTKLGMDTVPFALLKKTPSMDEFGKILKLFRDRVDYDIDGIIVVSNTQIYPVNVDKFPKYAWAYKEIEGVSQVEVTGVEWSSATSGALRPVIVYKPVVRDNSTCTRVVGHNARFIVNNKIGPGSVIKIFGRDLPNFLEVVTESQPALPDDIEFVWGDGVKTSVADIFPVEERVETLIKRNIVFFGKGGMDVRGIGPKVVKKLYDKGLTTVESILMVSQDELEAMGIPNHKNIYESIDELLSSSPISVSDLAGCHPLFSGLGISKKTMYKILAAYPHIYSSGSTVSSSALVKIPGVGVEKIHDVAHRMPEFYKVCHEIPRLSTHLPQVKEQTSTIVVFTGKLPITRGEAGKLATAKGWTVSSSLSKSTTLLVVGEGGGSKIEKAQKYGTKIINYTTFLQTTK